MAVLIVLAALGYYAWKLMPYTLPHATMALRVEPCAPGAQWQLVPCVTDALIRPRSASQAAYEPLLFCQGQ